MAEVKKIATRESYGATLAELSTEYPNLVVLDADLAGATKTASFKKVCPERFIDCGIAEGNMMGVAAGLAAAGMIPFASSFAMFAAGRAFEQVRNSIGYPHLNVKIGATHAGISVGEDGATHQCCEDIALMRSIPGMVVINPADDVEARAAVRAAAAYVGPVYLRFGRMAVPVFNDPETYHFELGKGHCPARRQGRHRCGHRPDGGRGNRGRQVAGRKGHRCADHQYPHIKPLDEELIRKAAKETGKIVTVEEHSVIGGLGDAVCGAVCTGDTPCRVVKMGVQDVFGHSGPGGDLITEFGLRAANIVDEVCKLCLC